jgi:hypothetical protein
VDDERKTRPSRQLIIAVRHTAQLEPPKFSRSIKTYIMGTAARKSLTRIKRKEEVGTLNAERQAACLPFSVQRFDFPVFFIPSILFLHVNFCCSTLSCFDLDARAALLDGTFAV